MVNAKADFDQYLNSIASKKNVMVLQFLFNRALEFNTRKVGKLTHCLLRHCICLLTSPKQSSTGAQKKGIAATYHTTHKPYHKSLTLFEKNWCVSDSNNLFHTENRLKKTSSIQISCYSFPARGQQGIWKGLPNWSHKELYKTMQVVAH